MWPAYNYQTNITWSHLTTGHGLRLLYIDMSFAYLYMYNYKNLEGIALESKAYLLLQKIFLNISDYLCLDKILPLHKFAWNLKMCSFSFFFKMSRSCDKLMQKVSRQLWLNRKCFCPEILCANYGHLLIIENQFAKQSYKTKNWLFAEVILAPIILLTLNRSTQT